MDKLWAEWLTLRRIFVQAQPFVDQKIGISAPFFSADSRSQNAEHRLLYVGQATSRGWYDDKFSEEQSVESSIEERLGRNREFVSDECGSRGFWLTFREMSKLFNNSPGRHENALWSNVMKIGVSSGNPEGLFFSMQAELAARTLRAEIVTYSPTVVVFVTGRYASSVVTAATSTNNRDWAKSEEKPSLRSIDSDIWWMPRNEHRGRPAYLWTAHPSRGISVARRSFWAKAALHLSSGGTDIADCV